eukprot:g116.t1
MSSSADKDIAFIGFIGAGKTTLMNALCGTKHPTFTAADSCTMTLQYGVTWNRKITIVDTPGFGSDRDVAKHIAGIKVALEKTKLRGIYIFVRATKAAEMKRKLNRIMDCFDRKMEPDMRVIITCCDQIGGDGVDPAKARAEYRDRISQDMGIQKRHIFCTGKGPAFPAASVETFIEQTLTTTGKDYTISKEVVISMSTLGGAPRACQRFFKRAEKIRDKAMKFLKAPVLKGKSHSRDTIVIKLQSALHDEMDALRKCTFEEVNALKHYQKNVVYGAVINGIRIIAREFTERTNKLLSWDVTDDSDPRNTYRHCPHCNRIFNKPPGRGCDLWTTCGYVPGRLKVEQPKAVIEFSEGSFVCRFDGLMKSLPEFKSSLTRFRKAHMKECEASKSRGKGCGKNIKWSKMTLISKELAAKLRHVELPTPLVEEEDAASKFDEDLASAVETAQAAASEKRSAAVASMESWSKWIENATASSSTNSSTAAAAPPIPIPLAKVSAKRIGTKVVYHGTTRAAAKKIVESGKVKLGDEGRFGGAFYTATDISTCRTKMLHGRSDPVFVKVRINLGTALVIDTRSGRVEKYDSEKLSNVGCTSIYAPHVETGPEYAVFDPDRVTVLSVHNADGSVIKIKTDQERTTGGAKVSKKRARRSKTVRGFCNCPKQHGLKKFYVEEKKSYTCHKCGTNQSSDTMLFGCRSCDYDVCLACYTKRPPLPPS